MKKTSQLFAFFCLVAALSLTACGEAGPAEKTGTTNTEDMVSGTDGGLDSLNASMKDSAASQQNPGQ